MIVPRLKLLQIDLTDECPLCCSHCSNSSGPRRDTHFPINKLREILAEAKDLGMETVVFSGGEPLRYPNLDEALSAANGFGTPATIFTTGIADKKTRLPISMQRWRELKILGLRAARFSVYASPSQREFHNKVVQTRPAIGDAFGANESAIREARSSGIAVEVHFVPSAASVTNLEEIYAWTSLLGCRALHLQIPTYQGRNKESATLELTAADEARLHRAVSALMANLGKMEFHISRFWTSRWQKATDFNSAANLEQLIIRTDGTVSPNNACKYGSVMLESESILTAGATLSDVWAQARVLREHRDVHRRRPQEPLSIDAPLAAALRAELVQRSAG